MPRTRTLCLVAAALALVPHAAHAQRRGVGPGSDGGDGWPPILAGVRAGYDYSSTSSLVGAQLRIPVLPSGFVELVPNGSITFLTGLKEYQWGVEAVLLSGGSQGGFYAGGGLGWRNTIYGDGPQRETRTAPTAVAGLRTGSAFGSPIGTQIEMRWTFVDGPFRPRVITFGVNVPLWGSGGRRR